MAYDKYPPMFALGSDVRGSPVGSESSLCANQTRYFGGKSRELLQWLGHLLYCRVSAKRKVKIKRRSSLHSSGRRRRTTRRGPARLYLLLPGPRVKIIRVLKRINHDRQVV